MLNVQKSVLRYNICVLTAANKYLQNEGIIKARLQNISLNEPD